MFSSILLPCSFAHTVKICTWQPQQCEIKGWNIYRCTLEDAGGWCRVGSSIGWQLTLISTALFFPFRSSHTHTALLHLISGDARPVTSTRREPSVQSRRWGPPHWNTVRGLNYKSLLHNMQFAERQRHGLVLWCSEIHFLNDASPMESCKWKTKGTSTAPFPKLSVLFIMEKFHSQY